MRPYVILNTVSSIDGRIRKRHGGIELNNRLNEYRVETLRGSVDAVMTGVDLIKIENPVFKVKSVGDKRPLVIILDKHVETPLESNVMQDPNVDVLLVTAGKASSNRLKNLVESRAGVDAIAVGQDVIKLNDLMWRLYERGIREILLEGSHELNKRMLDLKLVDELYISIAPVIVGKGVDFIDGELDETVEMYLEGIMQYGDLVVLHYLVK